MTKPPSPFADRTIRYSAIVCAAGFGGFLLWSSFAKLDEGVTASGQVIVEADRKSVQHFEGGIIRSLNVLEGAVVEAGDLLVEIEPLQSESARDELAQEYAAQRASLERLTALREGRPPDFAALEEIGVNDAVMQQIVDRQGALYREQAEAHEAELTVLRTRKGTLEGRARDLAREIAATRDALANAREDLTLRRDLLAEKLETIANVQQIEREVSRYEADLARLTGSRTEAVENARETEFQIAETRASFLETLGTQIVETQSAALSARERLVALDDRLARTRIVAPLDGTVLNLAVSTVGGVVQPGETIMEIVPLTDDLVASVRLRPTDRDAVQPGQKVEAQLSAYKSFRAPRLDGEVVTVSADLKRDEATGTYYYEARLTLDRTELDPSLGVEIIPGMPVDAFIASGQQRTLLDYVFEPILAVFRRGTRMS